MRMLVKGALVAGGLGAAAGAAYSLRKDESADVVVRNAAKAAGEAAAVGALVGWALDRRDLRRELAAPARVGAAFTATGLVEAVRAARPALELALEALGHVADQARPQVGHVVAAARPRVEHAAELTRQRALWAAEHARATAEQALPAMERAVERARELRGSHDGALDARVA